MQGHQDPHLTRTQGRGPPTHLAQRMHRNVRGIDVTQVTLSIVLEIVGDAEPGGCRLVGVSYPPRPLAPATPCAGGHSPQGLLAAPQVVLKDDASHSAPFAHASTVADEEARTLPTGEQDLVLL